MANPGKTLYLECKTGISGDMFVASLLDLGADKEKLEKALSTIPVKGFSVKVSRTEKNGLDCCDFDVILEDEYENHDHDMDYLYGGLNEAQSANGHDSRHQHHHDHGDGHHHHHEPVDENQHQHEHGDGQHHHHGHRNLSDVLDIIAKTDISDRARDTACNIFRILADAEAKAHGTTAEKVHFHEVGAIDSIVDIISAAVCLDNLGIENVIIPALSEGSGQVRAAHGVLSVPVPAVSNVIADSGIPLRITELNGERITPTGVAIAAAIRTSSKLPQGFIIKKIGMGAGKRAYSVPSIVRAMLIEAEEKALSTDMVTDERHIWKLESNLDDCSGETLGYLMDRLFENGARDVFYTPIFMKKNRPAVLLSVICMESERTALEDIIFKESTTIGIRRMQMERSVLERRIVKADTKYGPISLKEVKLPDGTMRHYPEYSDATAAAQKYGVPLRDVMEEAQLKASEL